MRLIRHFTPTEEGHSAFALIRTDSGHAFLNLADLTTQPCNAAAELLIRTHKKQALAELTHGLHHYAFRSDWRVWHATYEVRTLGGQVVYVHQPKPEGFREWFAAAQSYAAAASSPRSSTPRDSPACTACTCAIGPEGPSTQAPTGPTSTGLACSAGLPCCCWPHGVGVDSKNSEPRAHASGAGHWPYWHSAYSASLVYRLFETRRRYRQSEILDEKETPALWLQIAA